MAAAGLAAAAPRAPLCAARRTRRDAIRGREVMTGLGFQSVPKVVRESLTQ